jgi:hypothetical protein
MPVDPQIQALLDKGTGVPATHRKTALAAVTILDARLSAVERGERWND